MSNESRAENIPCKFRDAGDADGFKATEGKIKQ